jgi:Uma2 family endonuclease
MSTVKRPPSVTLPPLVAGQHLDQPTFHERYEAMPPDTRAELVGGVVYMPSPMRGEHGGTSQIVAGWLVYYQWKTPGLRGEDAATVKLDLKGEPQPDCQLRLPAELGGKTYIDEEGYITGEPELIVEIARSSRRYDLNEKKADYQRAGVREYLVIELDPDRIHCFICRGHRFVSLRPCSDGIYRSQVFPGLRLDAEALYTADLDRLIGVLEQGLATPKHQAFAAKLAVARARSGKAK